MFSTCTKILSTNDKLPKIQLNVLICGLHNAGKTTTIRRLLKLSLDDIVPTLGNNELYLNYKYNFKISKTENDHGDPSADILESYKTISLRLLDTSGKFTNIILQNCTFDTHAIIFILDSSNDNHIEMSRQFFKQLTQNEFIKNKQKPILILGNKQDLNAAKSRREIYKQMELENYDQNLIKINTTSGKFHKIDKGLKHGLKWLIENVESKYNFIDKQTHIDTNEYHQNQTIERDRKRKIIEDRKNKSFESSESKIISAKPDYKKPGIVDIAPLVKNSQETPKTRQFSTNYSNISDDNLDKIDNAIKTYDSDSGGLLESSDYFKRGFTSIQSISNLPPITFIENKSPVTQPRKNKIAPLDEDEVWN